MAKFTQFIPQNVATSEAEKIVIYNRKGNQVGDIALRSLANINFGNKLYSFGCLSDVHVNYDTAAEDLQRALKFFVDSDMDFITICGDLAYQGTESELNYYKTIVDAYSGGLPIYVAAGNHEFYQERSSSYLENYTGYPLYYTIYKGDDLFIFFGVISGTQGNFFETTALQWLYETLEANRNRRCFLFQHILLDDGCGDILNLYGNKLSSDTTEGIIFKSLLSHYHNIVFFHGHSHVRFRWQNQGAIANYDKLYGCHSVHIPSCAIPKDPNATATDLDIYYAGSEGYVVDVYDNGIHLKGRDFENGEYIPIASYWLDTTLQSVEAGTYVDSTGTIDTH